MNYRIVLASSSPRRRELLSTLGLGFDVIRPSSDETVSGNETPEDFVLRVSAEKASSVSRTLGDGVVVIGADTIVVVDGEI
ncbi:MAG: Maf family protein, partial [Thermodesulfobacteriota bacterium]